MIFSLFDFLKKQSRLISTLFLLGLWAALSFSSALSEVFLWVSVTFFIFFAWFNRSQIAFLDKTSTILICLFFLAVVVSAFISEFPKQSIRGLLKLVRHFLIFFMAFNLFRDLVKRDYWRMVFLFAFFIFCINAMVQYFEGVDVLRGFYAQASSSGWRVSGSFDTYGKFAAYLCCVLPVTLLCTIQSWKVPRLRAELLLWIPLSAAGLFLLFATRSRGGLLAFFLGLLGLVILRRLWKLLVLLILCGGIFVASLPTSMVIHLDAEKKEQSLVERFELWHRAWDVIRARPWTGIGINTYAVAHQEFDTRKNWRVQNYYAHNGYLQMGAEIGLPGLIFLLIFWGRWIWLNKPKRNDFTENVELRWGVLGGVAAFLIFCLADTALHSPQPVMVFWYLVGLLGSLNYPAQTEK